MSTKTNSVLPYKKMVMLKIFPEKQSHCEERKFYRFCLLCACLAMLLFAVVYLQILLAPPSATDLEVHAHNISVAHGKTCSDSCRIVLVESIPEGLEFNSSINPSIYQSWLNLIGEAQSSIDIASFYWTLTNKDTGTHEPTAYQGAQILKKLIHLAGKESDVSVRIAVNAPDKSQPTEDLNMLMQAGADVRQVNMRNLTTGVLHTKFWVIDKKHIYLGSANMDWRSLTQVTLPVGRVHPLVRLDCENAKLVVFEKYKQGVKELGVVIYNCSCLAEDLGKIFEAYWYLGQAGKSIPSHWPDSYSTSYNKISPLELPLNGTFSTAYLSFQGMLLTNPVAVEVLTWSTSVDLPRLDEISSPPSLCADGRTQDLDAILSVIDDAQEFVYIAVMNYLPIMEYSQSKRYWSEIDTQLRRVAYERAVRVHLLISCWGNSPPAMFPFLRSLAAVRYQESKLDIQVKLFVVPSSPSQKEIPYARVNHNKYMVTDKVAYIGTSNWSGDYFLNTAGSALVVNQTAAQSPETTVQRQLQAVFLRDWDSMYSTPLYQHSDTRQLCYR